MHRRCGAMALYNAFRYNYTDLNGCSLLVDIGARTTNLLFIESGRIFFRSIPMGGSAITAGDRERIQRIIRRCGSSQEARWICCSGRRHAEPADPRHSRAFRRSVRSTMTRLHAELMRSISHYRAQQQGKRPARIFLCGGAAGMPYMREFFHEKFRVADRVFQSAAKRRDAESAPMQDVAHSAHLLGELVGLALRSVTVCPMELNLRPASVVRRQDLEKRRPFFIAAAACILLALLGWSAYYTRAAQVAQQTAETLRQKNDTMHVAEGQLDKLKKQITALDNTATPLITAVNDRNFWPQILEQLNSRLPESDIWITELAATSGGKLLGVSEKRAAEIAPTPPPAVPPSSAAKAPDCRQVDRRHQRARALPV